MTFRVVIFDVLELRCLAKRWNIPIEMSQPSMQSWIAGSDVADVALEVLHIDWVEANNSGVKAYISFSDVLTEIVWIGMRGQVGFSTVKGGKQGLNSLLVSFLRTECIGSASIIGAGSEGLRRRKFQMTS